MSRMYRQLSILERSLETVIGMLETQRSRQPRMSFQIGGALNPRAVAEPAPPAQQA